MHKKVYLILVLVVALAVGAWAGLPARNVAAQTNNDDTSACNHASTRLTGSLAELPRIKGLIHDTCEFRVKLNQVNNKNVSDFDRMFIENAIAANMLELQSLQFTLERTTDPEWRGLIMMMIDMHTSDLEMAMAVAKKINADTNPNLTRARVFPETPEYDLGVRRVNLVAKFLDPLMIGAGVPPTTGTGTPTGVPTDMTGTATGVPTDMTGTATGVPTIDLTGTATGIPTIDLTNSPTAVPTDQTATPAVTDTATALPTDTATAVPTDTAMATDTATGVPTIDMTGTAMGSPTAVGTGTPGGGPATNFDLLAIRIIEDEHVMDIETALAAERLVRNDEIRAFAKHTADMAHLHLMLMNNLEYRLFHNAMLPMPRFEADYQSPRRFEPR